MSPRPFTSYLWRFGGSTRAMIGFPRGRRETLVIKARLLLPSVVREKPFWNLQPRSTNEKSPYTLHYRRPRQHCLSSPLFAHVGMFGVDGRLRRSFHTKRRVFGPD